MKIALVEGKRTEFTDVGSLVAAAPLHIDLAERVPGVTGKAFDAAAWARGWTSHTEVEPTHLYVEAVDEFTATIPWRELKGAAFLYERDGEPLVKDGPLRLYVPDGSSACLNVKSIVRIELRHEASHGDRAAYGFKNKISPDDLKKKG